MKADNNNNPDEHPFLKRPNHTLITLATPVLFSMIAEPLTGLVDTAWISRLGAEELAALGVGTVTLSGVFWISNLLGVGSQTEIAQLTGSKDFERASEMSGLAITLALLLGIMIAAVGIPLCGPASMAMGATGGILENSTDYMQVRMLAAPAILVSLTSFGILRGKQDMKSPMKIAILVNLINLILDPFLIFGNSTLNIPALGITGAALATLISQYIGGIFCIRSLYKHFGIPQRLKFSDAKSLVKIGGDLFLRTGFLTLFILLTTREATKIGADGGAAHQAIRQIWMFTALFLDSFAITGQSLIGYFYGAGKTSIARQAAKYVLCWSALTGAFLCVLMLIGTDTVINLLVPGSATFLFCSAWIIAAIVQPINAMAFATDGIHWGVSDFAFIRNVMILATGVGGSLLLFSNFQIIDPIATIWIITSVWISIRAFFGFIRVFPGLGKGPLTNVS